MRKNVRTILLIALAAATGANTQPPVKTFFQQLPAAKLPLPQNEVLQATDQIGHLSASDVKDLLPVLFAELKYDGDVGLDAALALYNVSLRPDSGDC